MAGLAFVYENLLAYMLGFSLLVAGLLALLELIPNSPHERSLRALQRGQRREMTETKDSYLEKSLARLVEREHEGTVLGVSKSSQQPVILADSAVNQLVLVLGTTGGGKTITLRRFYQREFIKHYPLIIVDGKPTEENTAWIADRAVDWGKPFYGFNCENFYHYDPLASGRHTELKDKLISLKDQWENDYYRSIAEDYKRVARLVMSFGHRDPERHSPNATGVAFGCPPRPALASRQLSASAHASRK